MADCPNHHPNVAGVTFCTTCGASMSQSSSSPSVQNLVTPLPGATPSPLPQTPTPLEPPPTGSINSAGSRGPLIAGASLGGVVIIALVLFLVAGAFGGPRMDTESPRALLMDSRDFDFDMVTDPDSQDFLTGEYSFFGEDCSQNRQAGDLLGDARRRASTSFMSGDGLYQFIAFDQALVRLPSAEEARELIDLVRAGSRSGACESDYEYISTNYSGTTTLEAFGYDIEDSVVYYGRTEIDSIVLEATLRRVFVLAAQDDHVLVISAAIDASVSDVSFGELERAVEYAVGKAYGDIE